MHAPTKTKNLKEKEKMQYDFDSFSLFKKYHLWQAIVLELIMLN